MLEPLPQGKPYMLGTCSTPPSRNFLETKFCWIIQVDGIITPVEYFSNWLTRISLAIGHTLLFSVQTVGAHNDCNSCATKIS